MQSLKNSLKRGPHLFLERRKKRYDTKYKLKVIEFAERHTNRETSRRFRVRESCVREWRKAKNKLTKLP